MIVSEPFLLRVAGRAEETLGFVERVGVHAARKHLARRRLHRVVGARQTGYRVEEDHHVVTALDHAFGLVQHHFGHLHVA